MGGVALASLPSVSRTLESPWSAESTHVSNGIQFEMEISDEVIIQGFDVRTSSAGTHYVEVWYRNGGFQGVSDGCANHNNFCDAWTQLTAKNVVSQVSH